jgi:Protein of unknown function (DUF1800)
MPTFCPQTAGPSPSRRDRSQPRRRVWLLLLLAACCIGLQTQASAQLSISGPDRMRFGASEQYSALVAGVPTNAVWSVNGVVGGTAATGPISATGMYTPVSTIIAGHSVTISATSGAASASLSVKLLNLLPIFLSGSVTQTVSGTAFSLTVLGSGFDSASQLEVAGANVATTFISSGELQSAINLSPGTTTVTVGILNPNAEQDSPVTQTLQVQAIPGVSLTQAARFLDQTTFGPTLAGIQQVQQIGIDAYLNQQFATPTTLIPAIPNPPVAACPAATYDCAQSSFWENALTANDQLRQRVAFALSEMFVVSTDMVNARTIPSYHNMLANDAFGNFSQLINDVATSAAMGEYLDMLNSGAPPAGLIADENFGRELMQLFTTGLYLVNPNGTLQLSAQELPQPVYTELQVQAYARALTGWTYSNPTGGVPTSFPNGVPNYDRPMQPIPVSHDTTAKVLLNGVTLPAGQTAEEDLAGLIASIFNQCWLQ